MVTRGMAGAACQKKNVVWEFEKGLIFLVQWLEGLDKNPNSISWKLDFKSELAGQSRRCWSS
jgi:hypothetical protein